MDTRTTPGIGPGTWDAGKLAADQERHALTTPAEPTHILFRIYTEFRPNLPDLVNRYFKGATFYDAAGLWQGQLEQGAVIDIVGTLADLQALMHLVGDIKHVNEQSSVLTTWQRISRLDV